jgi:hypothetical protein
MSTPMSPNAPAGPDDFREQLSAWHDGALPDEASRFVLKRLLGDESLRAEVGRWQVIGDALRRQPHQRPVGDLPARVAVAVAADEARRAADAPVIPGAVPVRSGSLRWLATAAALGLMAVLAWPSDPVPVAGDAATLMAEAPVPSVATALPAGPSPPLPMPPRRAEANPSAALVAAVPPLVRAPQPTAEQLAPLPAVDAPSRPWPRSASEQDVYTVDYSVPAAAPPRQ